MNKLKINLILVAIICALCGCERKVSQTENAERFSNEYSAAMDDYQAGRLDSAIARFQNLIRNDPISGTLAHFQLATILQDYKKDYIGAIVHYNEYEAIRPDADKAKIAKARAKLCKKLLEAEILRNSPSSDGYALSELNKTNKLLRAEIAQLQSKIAASEKTVKKYTKENLRLRKYISGLGIDKASPSVPKKINAAEANAVQTDAKSSLREMSLQISSLKSELKELDNAAVKPSAPLETNVANKATSPFLDNKSDKKKTTIEKPEVYIVKEGDTLYSLGRRFYGKQSAWLKIKEANKAIISSDNRIKPGQKLILP